jgi:hypothetical protein
MEVIILKHYIEALVSSESEKGSYYRVTKDTRGWTCTCKDHQQRKRDCKHINEVRCSNEEEQ